MFNFASKKPERDFYQVSLKAILKNPNGHILTLKSHEGGSYHGSWDLPGGRINTDEFAVSFEDILRREIREEIGDVKVRIHPLPVALGRHQVDKKYSKELKRMFRVLYLFFEVDYQGGDLVISDEHHSHEWIDLETVDLKDYYKSGMLQGLTAYRERLQAKN